MAVVVLVPHRIRPEAAGFANEATQWLFDHGHQVRVARSDAREDLKTGVEICDDEIVGKDADVAVSLGGDGTMLHAVDLVSPFKVPVLGINAGHLGYLTAVPIDDLVWALEQFFEGEFEVEERMMLKVSIDSNSFEFASRVAFNEMVVEKTVSGHTVHFSVDVGGKPFLTYAADGIIVATPSGSTAYNLSARGPIVSPHLRGIIVTPVSPHTLFDRSLVLHPDEFVSVELREGRPANLVVDGVLLGELQPGDTVTCRESELNARLVTFVTRAVHSVLRTKFGLSDR